MAESQRLLALATPDREDRDFLLLVWSETYGRAVARSPSVRLSTGPLGGTDRVPALVWKPAPEDG